MVTNKSDKMGHNMNEVLRLEERLLATGGTGFLLLLVNLWHTVD
jgi:hypothetical protein